MAKKKKQVDFKKVKLKVGRKIVKCANETDTSFKTRKIKLREARVMRNDAISSLTTAGNEDRTQIKLMKLRNASEGALITSPERITGDVIHILSRFSCDLDPQVRSEARKCLRQAFTSLQNAGRSLDPVMSVVMTHLKCGLTHLNPEIKKDSKRLLSFVIQNASCENVPQVAQVLLMLLKTKQNPRIDDLELSHGLIQKFLMTTQNNKSSVEPYELIWSEDNPYLPMHDIIFRPPPLFYDCSFKSDDSSSGDVKTQFLSVIKSATLQEIHRYTVRRDNNWSLSLDEARLLLISLKIHESLGSKIELTGFPSVTITNESNITQHKTKLDINKISEEMKILLKHFIENK